MSMPSYRDITLCALLSSAARSALSERSCRTCTFKGILAA